MEPTFIYYKNLSFDQNKRFALEWSDDNMLEGVLFRKNKDYYVTTISDKNCETRTSSLLIQCWLQVCLLISDLGCLAWLLLAWHKIESGGRGDSG